MAGNVTGLNVFQNAVSPEPLVKLDQNFNSLQTTLNTLNTFANFLVDTGTPNNLNVTTASGQYVSYADGLQVLVRIGNTNTGPSTLNINNMGPKPILFPNGSALTENALPAGSIQSFVYNASLNAFQLIGIAGGALTVNAPLGVVGPNGEPLFTVNTPVAGSGECLVVIGPGSAGAIQSGPVLCLNGMTNYPVLRAWAANATVPEVYVAEFAAGDSCTPGFSNGIWIAAGTNASDAALVVENCASANDPPNRQQFCIMRGDGSGSIGPQPNQLAWDTAGHFSLTGTATLPWPAIDNLPDITITNPQQGQVLSWDAATQKWVNSAPVTALATLTDVALATPAQGQSLVYDAATQKWVNAAPITTLATLTDVALTSPANGQSLTYNAATQQWVNSTPVTALEQLSNTHISGPAPGQVLTYSINPSPGWVNATIPGYNFLSNLGVGANPQAGWVLTWDGTAWVGAAPGQVAQFPLSSLTDVGITTPLNRQVLTYDAPSGKWINAPAPQPSLSTLPDVSLTAQTQGQVLSWDATLNRWVNSALPGGSVIALSTLMDANISDPQNNQVLTWDYASSRWVNRALPTQTVPPLATLPDVTLTSPTNGQALSYNGTRWVNSNTLVGPVMLNAGTQNTLTAYGAVNYNTLNIHGGANTQTNPAPYVASFTSHATVAGAANGVLIQAGSTSADTAFVVKNAAGTAPFLQVTGAGLTAVTQPIICQDVFGQPIWQTLPSDDTSLHIFQSQNGCGLWVEGANNSSTGADWVAKFVGASGSALDTAYGVYIRGGSSNNDAAFQVQNIFNNNLFLIRGDGTGFISPAPGQPNYGTMQWDGTGNFGFGFLPPSNTPRVFIQARPVTVGLYVSGQGAEWVARIINTNTAGNGYGLMVQGGIQSSDIALGVYLGNGALTLSCDGQGNFFIPRIGAAGGGVALNWGSTNGSVFTVPSARRFKTDIRSLRRSRVKDTVARLRSVQYRSTCEADNPEEEFYGLIAEEVAAVDPRLVCLDRDGKPFSVRYDKIAALLVPLVQELLGMDEPEGEVYG